MHCASNPQNIKIGEWGGEWGECRNFECTDRAAHFLPLFIDSIARVGEPEGVSPRTFGATTQ